MAKEKAWFYFSMVLDPASFKQISNPLHEHYALYTVCTLVIHTEAEYLDEIQTKVFRVFLLAIHSQLYSFALRFLFLQTLATSYSFYSSVTVLYTIKEKGGNSDRKPYPLTYGLRNPYRNLRTIKIMPRNLNEIVRS
jgi:hypothetical protein